MPYARRRTRSGRADGFFADHSIADLAFREAEEWLVVDFKTDGELGAHEQRYRRQVALCVRGISEATGSHAGGRVLLV